MNSRHHPPLGARAAVQCSASAIGRTSAASRPALPGAWITPGVACDLCLRSACAPARAPGPIDRRRTYVLDTSVLLADPRALLRFDEHEVVLPIVVLTELEAKRDHPELGWAARRALRLLEDFRLEHGSRHRAPAGQRPRRHRCGSSSTTADTSCLPASLTADNNDHRILAVARNLAAEGRDVTVVTKDLPLRLKASIVGLDADEYRNELAERLELDRLRRARRRRRGRRPAVRRPGRRPRRGPRPARATPASPCVAGSQSALGPGARRQAGAPRAGRPQPVRRARPLGRAAHRHRPARRPDRRHRVHRRPRRHRQVRARPRRRPRGRARAAHAQAGHGLPAALRRRRPGPRVPARHRGREDEPVGRGRHRRPRGDRRPGGDRRGPRAATCSRSCRSPTSGAAASPTPS